MELNRKHLMVLVGLAALGVAAYVGYRWWQARQGNEVGGLGTNLNSIAPELIGGSTGPSVGPAVNTPISITLNEAANSTAPAEMPSNMQEGVNARSVPAIWRQRNAVTPGVVSPVDDSDDSDDTQTGTDAIDGGADEQADDTIDQGVAA